MKTVLSAAATAALGARKAAAAAAEIGKCVHCGMCLPACPTYRLDSDERDSPRGRIYLVKALLEGEPAAALPRLDNCLTCRACETACPAGVGYEIIADAGREMGEPTRPRAQKIVRRALAAFFMARWPLAVAARCAAALRPLLPSALAHFAPIARPHRFARDAQRQKRHRRRIIVLPGCAQDILAAEINDALALIADAAGIGIAAPPAAVCCGALPWHLGRFAQGEKTMRAAAAAWAGLLRGGQAEAVVIASSACAASARAFGERLPGNEDAALAARNTLSDIDFVERVWDDIAPRIEPPSTANGKQPSRVSRALHFAKRAQKRRSGGGDFAPRGIRGLAGRRFEFVLRRGRDAFDFAPACGAPFARKQNARFVRARAGRRRHGQHRLPFAFARRIAAADRALAATAGGAAAAAIARESGRR